MHVTQCAKLTRKVDVFPMFMNEYKRERGDDAVIYVCFFRKIKWLVVPAARLKAGRVGQLANGG